MEILVACPECRAVFSAGPRRCPNCGELPPEGGFKETVRCSACGFELQAGATCGCGRQDDAWIWEPVRPGLVEAD